MAALLLFGVGICCAARRLRALPDEVLASHDSNHMDKDVIRMISALVLSVLVRGPWCVRACGGIRCHPQVIKPSATCLVVANST